MHFLLSCLRPDVVVASAGDDKKISFWHKKGRCLAVLPDPGTDVGDSIEVNVIEMKSFNLD
jgi:protein NEDD1